MKTRIHEHLSGSRTLQMLAGSAVFAIMLFMFPSPAHAQHWRRIPGQVCQAESSLQSTYDTGAAASTLVCPFEDSDVFRKQDVGVLNVHGFAGNRGVIVLVCSRSWYSANTGRCTAAKTAPAGEFAVSFSRGDLYPVWNPGYVADFGYIVVYTPALTAAGSSALARAAGQALAPSQSGGTTGSLAAAAGQALAPSQSGGTAGSLAAAAGQALAPSQSSGSAGSVGAAAGQAASAGQSGSDKVLLYGIFASQ